MDRKIKGFTLIEMLVVLSIMAILFSIGIPAYTRWATKYKIQNDTKTIFSVLNQARIKAFSEKRTCGISWSDSTFSQIELRCDKNYDGDIDDTDELIQKIDLKTSFKDGSNSKVTFKKEGFGKTMITIYTSMPEYNSKYNCIKISRTRILMGHYSGGKCAAKFGSQ